MELLRKKRTNYPPSHIEGTTVAGPIYHHYTVVRTCSKVFTRQMLYRRYRRFTRAGGGVTLNGHVIPGRASCRGASEYVLSERKEGVVVVVARRRRREHCEEFIRLHISLVNTFRICCEI